MGEEAINCGVCGKDHVNGCPYPEAKKFMTSLGGDEILPDGDRQLHSRLNLQQGPFMTKLENNLYHVQDDDCSMFVLAPTFTAALDRWRQFMKNTSPEDYTDGTEPQPKGVHLVAEYEEVLP